MGPGQAGFARLHGALLTPCPPRSQHDPGVSRAGWWAISLPTPGWEWKYDPPSVEPSQLPPSPCDVESPGLHFLMMWHKPDFHELCFVLVASAPGVPHSPKHSSGFHGALHCSGRLQPIPAEMPPPALANSPWGPMLPNLRFCTKQACLGFFSFIGETLEFSSQGSLLAALIHVPRPPCPHMHGWLGDEQGTLGWFGPGTGLEATM